MYATNRSSGRPLDGPAATAQVMCTRRTDANATKTLPEKGFRVVGRQAVTDGAARLRPGRVGSVCALELQRSPFDATVQVPYTGGMATRTKRIEMRADPDSEALISAAAAACRLSVSAFVLEAATDQAGRVLGRADLTLMPADQFDAFIAALDTPDEAPHLSEAARTPRRYTRQ